MLKDVRSAPQSREAKGRDRKSCCQDQAEYFEDALDGIKKRIDKLESQTEQK